MFAPPATESLPQRVLASIGGFVTSLVVTAAALGALLPLSSVPLVTPKLSIFEPTPMNTPRSAIAL